MTYHALCIIWLPSRKKKLICISWNVKKNLSWKFAVFLFRILMDLNMWNNQKVNVDCKLCFICRQQGKDKLCSTPCRIKSLLSNLFGFWRLGVLDITSSSVISTLHDEAELENYLVENEGKYQKVCASRYESQKLQRAIDNHKSISEEDNPIEPSPSLFCSFRMKKGLVLSCAICNEEDLSENLHADGSYHLKRKKVNVQHNKNFTEKWKEMTRIVSIQALSLWYLQGI